MISLVPFGSSLANRKIAVNGASLFIPLYTVISFTVKEFY